LPYQASHACLDHTKVSNMMSIKTILLVEDEVIIALAELNTLNRLGYEAVIADSGEKAILLAAENPTISLILMDINLGAGIDGTEAARRILAARNLPIVFLTSHSEREMVLKVRGITRYGFVLKNAGISLLQSAIEMAFELFEALERAREKDAALAQEQYLLQTLLDNSHDYIYFKDDACRFIRASKALARSFGLDEASHMIGRTDFDFFSEEHAQQAYEDEQAIIRTGEPLGKEEKETRRNRPDAWVSTEKMPLRDKEGKAIGTFGISRDITERKRAEERVEYHIRLYATLSKINRAIVYVKRQAELFDMICESIVAIGKFQMAWIGLLDETCNGIRLVASRGRDNEYLSHVSDVFKEMSLEKSPFGTAIRTGKVILYEDQASLGRKAPHKGDSRSSAAIPLSLRERVIGILNIHATETGFFTQEERGLLEEIGLDISFALDKMELEKEVEKAVGCADTA